MTVIHEPECVCIAPNPVGIAPCQCVAIRIGYQRGRDDAAKAVAKRMLAGHDDMDVLVYSAKGYTMQQIRDLNKGDQQ